jgi:16S rRNA (uracil1498-N3)-methyltransferase
MKSTQLEKKLVHWRGVAISACEQSGRAVIPALNFHTNLEQAIAASSSESGLLLDFDGAALAPALRPLPQTISILLGPEGGLTQPEIQLAKTASFTSVRLGPRILRTETAATAALAIVQSVIGDLG